MVLDKPKAVSLPSVRRLPAYLNLLRELDRASVRQVSSTTIAEKLRLDAIQVRKDLAITGIEGKTKVGFPVAELIKAIEEFLGWNNNTDAFLVGAGNLGSALLGYEGFVRHGLTIVAAFDVSPEKVGHVVQGKEVLHVDRLVNLARRMHITMGIIAVPPEAAQSAADTLVAAGIRAIWNFTPVSPVVPSWVVVQNEDLASGLAVLSVKAAQSALSPR